MTMIRALALVLGLLGGCARTGGGVAPEALPSTTVGSTAPSASSARNNASDEREQTSSAVNAALLACRADLEQAEEPGGKLSADHVKAWYCVCMTDALGVPVTPVREVDASAKRCVQFALNTSPKTPPSKRTPFSGKSFWTAGQIAGAQQGCLKKARQDAKTSALDESQRDTFCSCLVDDMRARRVASPASLPVDVTRTCANTAHFTW